MKSYAILVLAGAAFAAAQDLGNLPQCGQTCISNMVRIATSEFACAPNDIKCYCCNAKFGFGVRDCAQQACPNASDANTVISFGSNFCQEAVAGGCKGNNGGNNNNNGNNGGAGGNKDDNKDGNKDGDNKSDDKNNNQPTPAPKPQPSSTSGNNEASTTVVEEPSGSDSASETATGTTSPTDEGDNNDGGDDGNNDENNDDSNNNNDGDNNGDDNNGDDNGGDDRTVVVDEDGNEVSPDENEDNSSSKASPASLAFAVLGSGFIAAVVLL